MDSLHSPVETPPGRERLDELRSSEAHDELERRVKQRTRAVRRSRQRLRELVRHLETSREAERARAALRIHHEVAHGLALLKLELNSLETDESVSHTVMETVVRLMETIDGTIDASRLIARELQPFLLEEIGLVAAIEGRVEELTPRPGVDVRLDLPEDEISLGGEVRRALYRAFEAALDNSLDHASAGTITVSLLEEGGEARLRVTDDGVGFAADTLDNAHGFGLFSVHERIRSVGGTLDVDTSPGRGTSITVSVPREGHHPASRTDA